MSQRHVLMSLVLPALVAMGCGDEGGSESLCTATACLQAPAPVCIGNSKVTYQAIGDCTEASGTVLCNYPELGQQDCLAINKICMNGQCVDEPIVPCEDVVCDTPPAPGCNGDVAEVYTTPGNCDPTVGINGTCVYPVEASINCLDSERECRNGACIDPNADPCDPNPCNVPPLGTCNGSQPMVAQPIGACAPDNGSAVCTHTTTPNPACQPPRACYAGTCAITLAAPTLLGDLIITEIMRNPLGQDDLGEWIELFNPSDTARELAGCSLRDNGADNHVITSTGEPIIVPAGGYFILSRSDEPRDTGGVNADYVYGEDFLLSNGEDEIFIDCGGTIIDQVIYTAENWPIDEGSSLSLNQSAQSHIANDQPGSWCAAPAVYGYGDHRGSPRSLNPQCP